MPERLDSYARTPSDAACPALYPDCAWSPTITGRAGLTLFELVRGHFANGTLNNMDPSTDWVGSGHSYALQFDETEGEYAQIDTSLELIPSTNFTLAWWENIPSDSGDNFQSRFVFEAAGTANQFLVFRSAHTSYDHLAWGLDSSGGNRAANGATSITSSLTLWKHFALVIGDLSDVTNTSVCYEDGASVAIGAAGNFGNVAGSNRIGYDGTDHGPNCLMDDILIYHRQLTANQVAQLCYLGRGGWATRRKRSRAGLPSVAAGTIVPQMLQHDHFAGGLAL